MIFEDEFVISEPAQNVWAFLIDIPRVSRCLPGVERIEETDEGVYDGNLTVRVGPITARFAGKVQIVEQEAPQRLVARVEAKDNTTATVINGTFTATLEPLEDESTKVRHHIDVALRGRLAQFGTGVIQEVAKEITDVFIKCVQQQLDQAAQQVTPESSNVGTAAWREQSNDVDHPTSTGPSSMLTIVLRGVARAVRKAIGRLLRRN